MRRLALACLVFLVACAPPPRLPVGRGLNLVLISIDTLRADHLGCYGYRERPTSPVLDALAADGVRFARAYSQSPWTTPSHMTLLTSLYPSTHQLNQSFDDWKKKARSLAEEHDTLAEILRDDGYATFAMVGGATIDGRLGFRQGFDDFRTESSKLARVPWGVVADWLAKPRENPFFFFFHTFEVHAPYTSDRFADGVLTEEERRAMREAMANARADGQSAIAAQDRFLRTSHLRRREVTTALYDGGVRSADEFLGRLFAELRRLDLFDRTLIVVTSDHGEELGDHDRRKIYNTHGYSQYREQVHVPLLVRHPGLRDRGVVVEEPVGLIDVAPTVLEMLGVPVRSAMQGRSLVPLLFGGGAPRAWVLSEATTGRRSEGKALRTRSFSLLADYAVGAEGDHSRIPGARGRTRLFDLRDDPMELTDLAGSRRDLLRRMVSALEQQLRGLRFATASPETPLDEQLEGELRALGYL